MTSRATTTMTRTADRGARGRVRRGLARLSLGFFAIEPELEPSKLIVAEQLSQLCAARRRLRRNYETIGLRPRGNLLSVERSRLCRAHVQGRCRGQGLLPLR